MLPASALLVAKPETCISTLGIFLSVAEATEFGFQSTTWVPLVVFNSQEDRFLVQVSERFGWPVCVQSWAVGQAETLALDYCRCGLLVFTTAFYIQFCYYSTVQLQENHFPHDHMPLMLCSSITSLTSASESPVRGCAVLS